MLFAAEVSVWNYEWCDPASPPVCLSPSLSFQDSLISRASVELVYVAEDDVGPLGPHLSAGTTSM